MPCWPRPHFGPRFRAAGVGLGGSLASWFASVTLGLASLLSLLVYAIRRHKLDDYRGHYRWWLLASAAWMLMSVDATAGIHQLIGAALVRVSGQIGPLGETTIWLGGSGLILAAMSARLLWDMPPLPAGRGGILRRDWGLGRRIGDRAFPHVAGNVRHGDAGRVGKDAGAFAAAVEPWAICPACILHAQGLLPGGKSRAKAKGKRDAKQNGATANGSSGAAANIAKIDAAHTSPGQHRTDLHPHISPAPASRPARREVVR